MAAFQPIVRTPVATPTSVGIAVDSRTRAQRVIARWAEFRSAELDFGSVAEIGHSVADELFRVLPTLQPLQLSPVNTAAPVVRMIARVRAA